MLYHNWVGANEAGQAGCGGHSRQDATGLASPYVFLQFLFPAGGYKLITEKTTAAAAAADAGVVFYQYGATGINSAEHYQNLYIINSVLCSARGKLISALYGRRRRTGAASRPRIGGGCKMQPTYGAELTARCVPAACEPTS